MIQRKKEYKKNNTYLLDAFSVSDTIIIAWGRIFKKVDKDTRMDINARIAEVLTLLKDYPKKNHIF